MSVPVIWIPLEDDTGICPGSCSRVPPPNFVLHPLHQRQLHVGHKRPVTRHVGMKVREELIVQAPVFERDVDWKRPPPDRLRIDLVTLHGRVDGVVKTLRWFHDSLAFSSRDSSPRFVPTVVPCAALSVRAWLSVNPCAPTSPMDLPALIPAEAQSPARASPVALIPPIASTPRPSAPSIAPTGETGFRLIPPLFPITPPPNETALTRFLTQSLTFCIGDTEYTGSPGFTITGPAAA